MDNACHDPYAPFHTELVQWGGLSHFLASAKHQGGQAAQGGPGYPDKEKVGQCRVMLFTTNMSFFKKFFNFGMHNLPRVLVAKVTSKPSAVSCLSFSDTKTPALFTWERDNNS